MRDTGHGMDAATQAQIFEPFFTTKPVGSGTGLGLATVYGIVAQSGGHIGVVTAPGAGTAVTIYLPAVWSDAVATDRPPRAETAPRGARTVLLVDDDPAVRRTVRRVLSGQGDTVLEAGSGAEALALADRYATRASEIGRHAEPPIRAVITDVMMPGMRGPELVDRLRATMPEVGVLLMSGYPADTLTLVEGGRAELEPRAGVAFVEKPFSTAELVSALAGFVGAPGAPTRSSAHPPAA